MSPARPSSADSVPLAKDVVMMLSDAAAMIISSAITCDPSGWERPKTDSVAATIARAAMRGRMRPGRSRRARGASARARKALSIMTPPAIPVAG
ncbi:hypothetical protein [Arachnia propionica]|uniref:Uncharacterized protein n=1 Tax=Arachnia propionica TaxID=1750 RepID=A0AB37HU24_9ACTN|nr:hypothetical protein [Arachnia propionica]QUC10971.1 hypothetical protein J5A53_14630 [Arachnia propionica]